MIASATRGEAPLEVQLSCECDPSVVGYRWELGHGERSSAVAPAVSFPPGRHQVTLTAIDARGLTATDGLTVVVTRAGEEPPECEAFVDPPSGPAPLTAKFTARLAGPSPIEHRWELDGATLTEASFTREWSEPGFHLARLLAVDARGMECEARALAEVTRAQVRPPRIAALDEAGLSCGRAWTLQPAVEGTGPIAWTIEEAPPGLAIDAGSGALSWTPTGAATGARSVVLVASNEAGSDRVTVPLEVRCERAPPMRVGCGCEGAPGALGVIALGAIGFRRRRGRGANRS